MPEALPIERYKIPKELGDFDHQQIWRFDLPEYDLKGFIAFHLLYEGIPSFGATRLCSYPDERRGLLDVLRLSKLMSYKSALAGFEYGGAKAVIFANDDLLARRDEALAQYAHLVSHFKNKFITGTDLGLNHSDVEKMRKITPNIVGVGVDPAYFTAYGVLLSMQMATHSLFGSPDLDGLSIAIQGVGNVGYSLLESLYKKVKQIYVTDIDNVKLNRVKDKFPQTIIVQPDEIYDLDVDIFSPCALNGILNEDTVQKLKCKMVVGAANNQLASHQVGQFLFDRKIMYLPDYIVNAGGLISVIDEYENNDYNSPRIKEKISVIVDNLHIILKKSKISGKPTDISADSLAKEVILARDKKLLIE